MSIIKERSGISDLVAIQKDRIKLRDLRTAGPGGEISAALSRKY